MNRDRQIFIGPYKQFIMYPSNYEFGKKIYLLVPGFGQNGSGLYYLYSELYKRIRDNNQGIPVLFDYVNSGDSKPQVGINHNSVEDYFRDFLIILDSINKYKPIKINVILTGMSMFYIPSILHYKRSLNIVLIPPYPTSILKLEVYKYNFNTSDEFKINPSIRKFFENLGSSWSAWKGIDMSNEMFESLLSRANKFNKLQAIENSKIAFDFYDHNLPNCIKLYHNESMTIIHPDDRIRIMENLK